MLKYFWIFSTIFLLTTTFAAEFQHDERERRIYRDYIDALRNTSVGSYEGSEEYVYDPDVNPPWGKHSDLLKGEVVFIDQQYIQMAVPKDSNKVDLTVDLKHCQKGAQIVEQNPGEREYCLCYAADGKILDQTKVAPHCFSREMFPICIKDKDVTYPGSGVSDVGKDDLKMDENSTRLYAKISFDFTTKKVSLNGKEIPNIPFPVKKKVYRFESDAQIDVLEFKSPNCIHMSFENLIYTGSLVQTKPFKKKRFPNVCRAGCACRSVPDVNGDYIQIVEDRDSSSSLVKISALLMTVFYAIFG